MYKISKPSLKKIIHMTLNDFISQAIKAIKIELIDMVKNSGHMPKTKSYGK